MDKINQLISCQMDRLEKIQRSQINFSKCPKSRITISYIETRLENLEQIWKLFIGCHEDIIGCVDSDKKQGIAYFSKDIYYECEEVYINHKSDLKIKLQELAPITTAKQTTLSQHELPHMEPNLPRINIPLFSGKYTEWPSFHDIYVSLIHNNSRLDDVQKLHYLKTSLSGEAESLLRSIPITSQNYSEAWETLKKRYNNKRYISNCLFRRLFSLKNLTTESDYNIKQILDTTSECLSSLKNLGLPTSAWDAIMVYMTATKLDNESYRLWEQHIADHSTDFVSLDVLFHFLETRFRTLEMLQCNTKTIKTKSFHAAVTTSKKTPQCSFCNSEEHYIYQCKQFAKKDYKTRYAFVQNNNLCFNCLIPNHSAFLCKRTTCCKVCQKKHHSLLHPEKRDSNTYKQTLVEEAKQADQSPSVSHFSNNPGQVLLATALVDITTSNGQTHVYRALIDQGSQSSFVSENFAQATGLKRCKMNSEFYLSEGKTIHSSSMIEFELKSRYNTNFILWVQAYVISRITTYLPQKQVVLFDWPEIDTITLADPGFHQPGRIDMLLGAGVTSKIMRQGLLRSPVGIIAQNTQLGWIISGDTNTTIKNNKIVSMHSCVCENNMLKQFWELERESITTIKNLTKEEETCEEIYKATTVRTETGRYKVNLPFQENINTPVDKCGKTQNIATSRFLQLEKRLLNNPKLKDEYIRVIQEYQELGHMSLVDEDKEDAVYLPHHAVIREDKDTTKVRVVFDASCKGTGGS